MTSKKPKSRVVAVSIYCTDRDRSERFYEQALGAVIDTRDGNGCRWYRLGDLFLTLVPNAGSPSPAKFPAHAMPVLWVEVDDLGAAEQLFACHGGEVVQPSDGQFMMIADPDGLVIEVWQADR